MIMRPTYYSHLVTIFDKLIVKPIQIVNNESILINEARFLAPNAVYTQWACQLTEKGNGSLVNIVMYLSEVSARLKGTPCDYEVWDKF